MPLPPSEKNECRLLHSTLHITLSAELKSELHLHLSVDGVESPVFHFHAFLCA